MRWRFGNESEIARIQDSGTEQTQKDETADHPCSYQTFLGPSGHNFPLQTVADVPQGSETD